MENTFWVSFSISCTRGQFFNSVLLKTKHEVLTTSDLEVAKQAALKWAWDNNFNNVTEPFIFGAFPFDDSQEVKQ